MAPPGTTKQATKKPKKVVAVPQRQTNTIGTGAILAIAAGLAGLWWWRRRSSDGGKGGSAGQASGSSGKKRATAVGDGGPRINNKKKKNKSKMERQWQKQDRDSKRQAHLDKQDKHANAPKEDAVVKDESRGIHGDHLYLNYGYFNGSKKK